MMMEEKNRLKGFFAQQGMGQEPPATATAQATSEFPEIFKVIRNVLDVAVLGAFSYYVVTGKPAPRYILVAGAVSIAFRLVRNLKLLPKEAVDQLAQIGL